MMKINKIIVLIMIALFCSCSRNNNFVKNDISYKISDFCNAIDNDDLFTVNKIIESGFNINEYVDENENNLLDYAIAKNKETISSLLIENGIDINHKDINGKSIFTKSIGKISATLLEKFVNFGLDYTELSFRNMNYFEYMLFKKEYECAYKFITDSRVYDFFQNNSNLLVYLIYYWDSQWSQKIGNFLIEKGYMWNNQIPYYFYAIDEGELSAIKWLKSIGISYEQKYYDELYEAFYTPREYAINRLQKMTHFLGKDYVYTESDEEVLRMKEIINIL